ncbi:MAG: BACON domain-containing protein, partial [Flavobacteriales bacterium]
AYIITGTKSLNFTVPSNAVEGTTRMRVYVKNFPNPTTSPCNTSDQGGDIEDFDIVVVDHRNLDVNPLALSFISSGQGQNVTVSSDSIWQVTCPAAWINLSAASGSGNGPLGITAIANTTTTTRSAIATFTRGFRTKTVFLEQQGEDSLLNIIEASLSIPATGNSYVVNVVSNVAYTINSSATWITTNASSGSGISSFDVNVGLNSLSSSQNGYVTVQSGTKSDTLWITQDANATTLSLTPTLINFPETASNQLVSITTSGSWIVSSNDAWLTIDINSGSGNSSLTVFAEENTGIARTGSVTVTNGIINELIVVNQNGINGINDLSADEKPLVFPNPARDMITILSPEFMINSRIEIYSTDGKLIVDKNVTGKSTQLFVQSLERGVYLIKLTSTDSVYFIPLILSN